MDSISTATPSLDKRDISINKYRVLSNKPLSLSLSLFENLLGTARSIQLSFCDQGRYSQVLSFLSWPPLQEASQLENLKQSNNQNNRKRAPFQEQSIYRPEFLSVYWLIK